MEHAIGERDLLCCSTIELCIKLKIRRQLLRVKLGRRGICDVSPASMVIVVLALLFSWIRRLISATYGVSLHSHTGGLQILRYEETSDMAWIIDTYNCDLGSPEPSAVITGITSLVICLLFVSYFQISSEESSSYSNSTRYQDIGLRYRMCCRF